MKKTFSFVLILALSMVTEVAKADFVFGEPVNMGPTINTSANDLTPRVSADGLSLYFASMRAGGYGDYDLWVMTRITTMDSWSTPVNLGPTVNSSAADYSLSISADDRTLYFVSNRAGGSGGYDLWATTRATTEDPWGEPENLGTIVNSSANEYSVGISADSLTLYFTSNRPSGSGGYDLWVTTRQTTNDLWTAPVNLGPTVNSTSNEWTLGVPSDTQTLYIASDRSGGYGQLDLWVTRWSTTDADWGEPINLGPRINSSSIDGYPIVSADGQTLYFSSNRAGGSGGVDLWQASITPIVDFNADGMVDSADMCIMVDHWGEDYSLCDISPMPWGDGIVDVEDLKVLADHLFEDNRLVAHWMLDEAEGTVAYDSAQMNDATVLGDPVWQPQGGIVGGALAFDGIDDYVSTEPVLDPADGSFSVFAWIKGGAPGQAIISQQTAGVNWLCAATSTGNLMTELGSYSGGRSPVPVLSSQTVIADGDWHRVGFIWDNSDRILYVDDFEVARDTVKALESAEGGLYIGASSALESDGFFFGLIDDVRIYNRAVSP